MGDDDDDGDGDDGEEVYASFVHATVAGDDEDYHCTFVSNATTASSASDGCGDGDDNGDDNGDDGHGHDDDDDVNVDDAKKESYWS